MDRRETKLLRSFTQALLSEKAYDFSRLEFLKSRFDPDKVEKLNVAGAIVLAQVARAIEGDTVAASWVRDTAGERPNDRVEVGLLKEGEVVINLVSDNQSDPILYEKPLQISNNDNKIK